MVDTRNISLYFQKSYSICSCIYIYIYMAPHPIGAYSRPETAALHLEISISQIQISPSSNVGKPNFSLAGQGFQFLRAQVSKFLVSQVLDLSNDRKPNCSILCAGKPLGWKIHAANVHRMVELQISRFGCPNFQISRMNPEVWKVSLKMIWICGNCKFGPTNWKSGNLLELLTMKIIEK